MQAWLSSSGLDRRYLGLWAFVVLPFNLLMVLITFGGTVKFLPFFLPGSYAGAVLLGAPGWALAYRATLSMGGGRKLAYMLAAWVAVFVVSATLGLATQFGRDWHPESWRFFLNGFSIITAVGVVLISVGVVFLYWIETNARPRSAA